MSTVSTEASKSIENVDWINGIVGGVVAGIVTGLLLQFVFAPRVISSAVPAMYGVGGTVVGWVLYLVHSIVFGLVYAAITNVEAVKVYAREPVKGAGLGAVYGVALWIVVAVILVPLWLSAVGFEGAPTFPFVSPLALLGYLVFGISVGFVYGLELYS